MVNIIYPLEVYVIGYNGTLDFDWVRDDVKVFIHNTPRVEVYKMDSSLLSHGGGDEALALNFIRVMQGRGKICCSYRSRIAECINVSQSEGIGSNQFILWYSVGLAVERF